MRSETRPISTKQIEIKEMFTRVMMVAEILSKSSKTREQSHQLNAAIPQKTQK